ncbi:MAG: TRAP transporter large permease [Deltaproteobacteria bacterium]|nr:TRAP transporter large permease [Deltaproteobacteria bacterium]MBW1923791.1 TRAP transporter large permease [Deltaproteobacteria bacterium]MBW2103905.1 TRAP transporter large permease [Deltaproteobacteria bacterium]MBW2349088.1 TRAP transporter large permease [Deltaproteobacteria bacterium]
MDPILVGVLGFATMLGLILLRVHIAIAMGLVGLGGATVVMGSASLGLAKVTPYGTTASFEQAVLPLFVLMGMFAASSGIALSLFNAAQRWLGRIRGGLLMATTLSIGLFGACCGSSVAAATTFTKIALPPLIRHKFDPGLSGGAIAAGGTQAALIPPSALLVFYGILTEQSVGKLLLAGVLPGIVSICIYMIVVWITLRIFPEKGPEKMHFTWTDRFHSLAGVWPIPVIFLCILGGLYFGVFTPSEAGAIGAFLTLIVAVVSMGGWKGTNAHQALISAVNASAMIFIILVMAMVFVRFVALTQIPFAIGDFISNLALSPVTILMFILVIYLLLGCVLDAVGMIALTIPVIYPVIEMLNIDGIWFGILLVKVAEIGLITPPIGINVFVVQGASGGQVGTGELFRGIVPFIIADIVTLIVLVAFPQITLWIPNRMG